MKKNEVPQKQQNSVNSQNFIDLIKQLPQLSENFYACGSIVLSVFRHLSPLAQQFILRSTLFHQKPSSQEGVISKKILLLTTMHDKGSKNISHISSHALHQLQELRIFYEEPQQKKQCKSNSFFMQLGEIFQNGLEEKFLQAQHLDENQVQDKSNLPEEKWRQLHEIIVGMKSPKNLLVQNIQGSENTNHSNIYDVLINSGLVRVQQGYQGTSQITELGFEFILASTSRQKNFFLLQYAKHLIEKRSRDPKEVLSFILQLNLLSPEQVYFRQHCNPQQTAFSTLQNEILNDLQIVGLIAITNQNQIQTFHTTPLLNHFSYEQNDQTGMNVHADILVETTFRIYAFHPTDFTRTLLSQFCRMEYEFSQMLVGTLTKESVTKAYERKISSAQLIDFFNKNIDPNKYHSMKENTNVEVVKRASSTHDQLRRLDFLRLYDITAQEDIDDDDIWHSQAHSRVDRRHRGMMQIPDNVAQQLKFWEQEKDIQYDLTGLKEVDDD